MNFQDHPVQPFDVPTAQDVVFNQVNGFYKENSQNQTWLVGDVFGWFTIAVSSSTCDFSQIQTLGEAAATNAGATLSNYNRFVYVFPNIPACGWEGLANLGGSPSHAWVNGFMNLQVVGHELGHGFGLLHSHSQDCSGLTLGSNCTKIEYGDPFDIMGHNVAGHFNAFQKERLGWLNYGTSPPIQFVQSSGTYTIAPYEDGSPGPKALKFLESIDASTGFTTYYYAEYRQNLGFDSVLSPYPASTQGVLIHSGDPSSPNNLYLLNMNPKDTTFYTAALSVGENFSDPTSGVSLTTVKADAKGAVVNVTLNPPACAPQNPTVTISPSQGAPVTPGTTVPFAVTVTDQDSYTCNPATFTMRAFLPNGFTSNFSNASLTLAPGATGQATLFLTSSPGTPSGSYSFTTVAANAPYAQLQKYYKRSPGLLIGSPDQPKNLPVKICLTKFRIARGPTTMKWFKHDRTFTEPLSPITTFFMVIFHIGAIAALFMFSWKGVALAAFLWFVSGCLGIGMGYHRLLTHRGYKTYKWVEYFFTLCATLALEGGPFFWVATHRVHHQNTDKEGDPHTPHDGGFWSHMGWIITGRAMHNNSVDVLPYVPDLRKDEFHTWISRWHWVPITVLGIAILAIGGWKYLMWGIFLRTVVGLHSTWLVNSATHMWGTQRFLTGDSSKNSFWVAILTFGEGWHNNHHAHPQSARHGLAWYEVDINWYGIWCLRKLGLAWDVKLPKIKPEAESTPALPTAVPVPAAEELVPIGSGD